MRQLYLVLTPVKSIPDRCWPLHTGGLKVLEVRLLVLAKGSYCERKSIVFDSTDHMQLIFCLAFSIWCVTLHCGLYRDIWPACEGGNSNGAPAKKSWMQIWLVDSTWIDTKDTAFPLLGVRGGATHNCNDNAALLLLCASEKWKSWPTFFDWISLWTNLCIWHTALIQIKH